VHRFWVIPCAAAMLLASGCLGSSSAQAPTVAPSQPAIPSIGYADFEIIGTYTTSGGGNHFTGKRHHEHFALACRSQRMYEGLSLLSPQDRLCFAILDYQNAPRRRDVVCFCSVKFDEVSVRGEIRGRRINERFTYCMCGDGRRAGDDARVILKTHPPFQVGLGGA
jgi:opacity protein-like surface antigen